MTKVKFSTACWSLFVMWVKINGIPLLSPHKENPMYASVETDKIGLREHWDKNA